MRSASRTSRHSRGVHGIDDRAYLARAFPNWIEPGFVCCDAAVQVRDCVCSYRLLCTLHGSYHIGTHD